MEFSKKIEQELKTITLSSNDYLELAEKLRELGLSELRDKVLQTGAFTYKENRALNKLLSERGFMLPKESEKKVFVIGLSQTGTDTLSLALEEYSFTGRNWNGLGGKQILDWEEIEKLQFSSDTPVSFIFESLYYAYPSAYFIYTTRHEDSWESAMERSFNWAEGFSNFRDLVFRKKNTSNQVINLPLWAVIHRNLYANADSWKDAFRKFDRRVKKFFSSNINANFLMLDFELPDEEKWSRVSSFLGINFVPIKPFPKSKNNDCESFANLETINSILSNRSSESQIKNEYTVFGQPLSEYIASTITKQDELKIPSFDDSNLHYALATASGKKKDIDLISVKNAFISFDFTKKYSYKFYIFNENKEYLKDVSHGEAPFLLDEQIILNKKIGFLEDKFSNFNVCHLLTDKLPRLKQLERQFFPDEYILFHPNEYTKQVCSLLDFKVLNVRESGCVTFKLSELFLTSSSSYTFIHPGQNLDSNFKNLKTSLLSKVEKREKRSFPKRIFIDRADAKTRNIINQDEFYDLLHKFHIEPVKLESLTVMEQIHLFKQAELVVAVHGAGLTNTMFSEPGTDVIEILPPLCATPAFFKIALANNLSYHYFVASDEEFSDGVDYSHWKHEPAKYNRRNVIIDVKKFGQFLQAL